MSQIDLFINYLSSLEHSAKFKDWFGLIWFGLVWFGLVLLHVNHVRLQILNSVYTYVLNISI